MKIRITKTTLFSLCILLVGVFSVSRIYRNSFAYSNTEVGGIWNVIALLFMFLSIIAMMGFSSNRKGTGLIVFTGIATGVLSQLNCLFNIGTLQAEISSVYYFITIAYFGFVIALFYRISPKLGETTKTSLIIINIAFFAIAIVSLVSLIFTKIGNLDFSMVADAYYILAFLPLFVCCNKKKVVLVIGYLLAGIVILLSVKRLGLIAFAVFIFIMLFVDALVKRNVGSIVKVFLVSSIIVVIFLVVYNKLSDTWGINTLDRISNMTDDGGSGRDVIYANVWEAIKNSNIYEQIFGHGMGTVGAVTNGHGAHNDFLHNFYQYGFLPTLSLALFYLFSLFEGVRMIKARFKYAPQFIGITVISILLSAFSSYSAAFGYVTCGCVSIGYLLAQWRDYRLQPKREEPVK